jgi:hypothetical protein
LRFFAIWACGILKKTAGSDNRRQKRRKAMKKHPLPPRLLMTRLDERYYDEAPRQPVVCRLWRLCPAPPVEGTAIYAIGMESPVKRYLYCVGQDEAAARRLWESMVEARLSPVHLGDVVEDFLWEQGQRGKEAGEFPEKTLQTDPSMV